jgi:hypothetical protein
MIAFKVYINGEYKVTAGQDDWAVLAGHVTATRDESCDSSAGYIRYSVGGLSLKNEYGFGYHFRWKEVELNVGDKIEFEVADLPAVADPVKRYRSDHQVQEDPFTEDESREMRYQDYLALKKEFESENT